MDGESVNGGFERWLEGVAAGDAQAVCVFWDRYFERLLAVARRRFAGLPRRVSDEEDVALSAMNSVLDGFRNGRFGECDSATALWKLLLTVTARKVCAERRRYHAARRGGGRQRGESVFGFDSEESANDAGIQGVPDDELTPDLVVTLRETTENLFKSLADPQLAQIAQRTLEGYTPKEIAEELGVVPTTIRRKLRLIGDSLRGNSEESRGISELLDCEDSPNGLNLPNIASSRDCADVLNSVNVISDMDSLGGVGPPNNVDSLGGLDSVDYGESPNCEECQNRQK